MNKKIRAFFEERGFVVEGNNAYGKIGNFNASMNETMLDNVAPVKIQLSLHAVGPTRSRILNDLRALKFKFFRVEANLYGILLGFNGMTINSLLKNLPDMLDKIVGVLNKHGALGENYCPLCGKELVAGQYQTYTVENWIKVDLDEECVGKLNNVIKKENEDFAKAPNNYLKGTLGALIGALAGAVAYIILASIGYIAAISAVLAVFLGNYFYVKFGGKANNVKNIIVALVSLVVLVLACVGIYYVEVGSVIAANNLNMTPFELIFSDEELTGYFVYDMAMNVIFTIIGVVAQVASTKRKDQSSRTRVSR